MTDGKFVETVRCNYTDEQILQALEDADGNKTLAAVSLGVARKTYSNWIFALNKEKNPSKKLRPLPLDQCSPPSTLVLPKEKRFTAVITCAQNNTELDGNFLDALYQYCAHNNAHLIVIPIRYKNVSAYINQQDYSPQWPAELTPYYLNHTWEVNKNLLVMGDYKIQATARSPLSTAVQASGPKSAIFGHPQFQLKTIPSPTYSLPRQLQTSMSCSQKNYSMSKTGMDASAAHDIGALVLEVHDDLFWIRQLFADDNGGFYDLDTYYEAGSDPISGNRVAGMVGGDLHVEHVDQEVVDAVWGPGSITELLRPERQYHQDVFDCYSVNHHHNKSFFTKYIKHQLNTNNVEQELNKVSSFHNKYLTDPDCEYYYIPSNHHDHLMKWLNDADPKQDPENALFYYKLMSSILEHTGTIKGKTSIPNPLEYCLRPKLLNAGKVHFPSRRTEVTIFDIDINHGDGGPNGAKGSVAGFARSGNRSITGHGHSPEKEKKAWRVGTFSKLQLDYNGVGYSSWLHTLAIIYPNGMITLCNVIKGMFRRPKDGQDT